MLCYDQRLELLPSERKPNSLLQRVSFCERLDQFILQRDADRFLRISVDSGDEGNRCLIVLRRQPLLTDEKVFAVWLQSWATEPGQQAIRDLKSLSSSNTCSFEHQYIRATALGGLPAYGNTLPGNGNASTVTTYPPSISCLHLADAENTYFMYLCKTIWKCVGKCL